MFKLDCVAQNYSWGKVGSSSMVATFKKNGCNNESFHIDPEMTYAELWMGTHPNGPSSVIMENQNIPLLEWIQENPEMLGKKLINQGANHLPYLFKVLSIQKALSVQAHPDRNRATQLFQEQPHIYKDPNHKPEMAIALTPFEAMCQFRPIEQILKHFDNVGELRALVSTAVIETLRNEKSKAALKKLFTEYITAEVSVLKSQYQALYDRLCTSEDQETLSDIDNLILRLCRQYPNDIGVFSPYLLNYVVLSPGEAIFLAANEPHAYISGDCIECMACSDNVVRAGLTSKLIDKAVLCEMLTYSSGIPNISLGDVCDSNTIRFTPPVEEFQIEKTEIPVSTSYLLGTSATASIFIVTNGSGTISSHSYGTLALSIGTVFFIGANIEVEVVTTNSAITLFRAHGNESL